MKESSEKNKLKQKRGQIFEDGHQNRKMPNEKKSTGAAAMICDPIAGKTVRGLSRAEKKVFWVLRFWDDVDRICNHVPMGEAYLNIICEEYGFRKMSKIIRTNFLIQKEDGSIVAVSVEDNEKEFNKSDPSYGTLLERKMIEKEYWESVGFGFLSICADDIPDVLADNIKDVMTCYPENMAIDNVGKLKHMIARKFLKVPMDKERIRFADLEREIDVEALYEKYKKQC